MEKVFLVYSADTHLTKDSYCLQIICSTLQMAIYCCELLATLCEDDDLLTEHDIELLNSINQTQNRTENYVIQEVLIDNFIFLDNGLNEKLKIMMK